MRLPYVDLMQVADPLESKPAARPVRLRSNEFVRLTTDCLATLLQAQITVEFLRGECLFRFLLCQSLLLLRCLFATLPLGTWAMIFWKTS